MRRAFIAFGFLAFLVYCWASVAYQNQVDVPGYRLVEIDLLGGMSREKWASDEQAQFQRLMELEGKNYQLPPDAKVQAPSGPHAHADADGNIPPERPLVSADFVLMIEDAAPAAPVKVTLRDTSAFYGLLGHNYLLRDSIPDPGNPDGQPLYTGGQPLHKEMLDDLNLRGHRTITVTGHGSPVSFQLGTAIMIAIIFLTLVAALKPVLWDPFMVLLEKRRRELEIGSEAERQNQLEAARFEEERRSRHEQLGREIQAFRMRGQSNIAKEAGAIVKQARNEEKEIKLSGLRELTESADAAEERLAREIPELAEAVADALTPGRGGRHWHAMADKET